MSSQTRNTEAELLSLIDRFSGAPVTVVGDVILDSYVWGEVERISPEAPVVVVKVTRDTQSLGGAANVANNLAALGAHVRLIGVVGDDENGRLLKRILEERQIDSSAMVTESARPTTVKTRVIAAVQQVVRIDREVDSEIAATTEASVIANLETLLKDSKAVLVSDYAKGMITPGILAYLAEQSASGRFGRDAIPLLIDPKDRNFSRYRGATVIKPNRKEAQAASKLEIRNRAQGQAAARALIEQWDAEMVLITLGAEGMILEFKDETQSGFSVDTQAREVFDVSGAGDTVAAVFGLTLAVGGTPVQAAELANYAAGIVVGSVGAVAVPLERLREVVARGEV